MKNLDKLINEAIPFYGLDIRVNQHIENMEINTMIIKDEEEEKKIPIDLKNIQNSTKYDIPEKFWLNDGEESTLLSVDKVGQSLATFEARGLTFKGLDKEELETLKTAFGSSLHIDKNKDIYTLITHIEEKSKAEQVLETVVDNVGSILTKTANVMKGIGAGIFAISTPSFVFLKGETMVQGLTVLAGTGVGLVALGYSQKAIGAGLINLPRVFDKIENIFEMSEKEAAKLICQFRLDNNIQLETSTPIVNLNNDKVINNITKIREIIGVSNNVIEKPKL